MGFAIVWLTYTRSPMKKMLAGWHHMLLQTLYILFSLNGAFPDVQATQTMGTSAPPHRDG